MLTRSKINSLVYKTIGAAIRIHKQFGPGLYESFYHQMMIAELEHMGIAYEAEKRIKVNYLGVEVDTNLRFDLLVEGVLVVELKAVTEFVPIHEVQLKTYLKLLNLPKGLMINFNVRNIYKTGQKTKVLQSYYDLPEK